MRNGSYHIPVNGRGNGAWGSHEPNLRPLRAQDLGPEAGEEDAALEAASTSAESSSVAGSEGPPTEGIADRLHEVETERDEYLAMARQARSDLENYRRRARAQEGRAGEERLAAFLQHFLDAFDDLDRVIEGGAADCGGQTVFEGARLARENLWKQMQQEGVTTIPAAGTRFDPTVHEAIATVPAGGEAPGTVVEVVKPGYRLGERVIRPAQVVVANPQG